MKDVLVMNGRVPSAVLYRLSWAAQHRVLTGLPAAGIEDLNDAYQRQFKTSLTVNYSYRPRWRQVAVRMLYPRLAAPVGHSLHGFGLALDLGGGIQDYRTEEHKWMQENAPKFMWDQPSWAQQDGLMPEPWHWEFML